MTGLETDILWAFQSRPTMSTLTVAATLNRTFSEVEPVLNKLSAEGLIKPIESILYPEAMLMTWWQANHPRIRVRLKETYEVGKVW